MTKQQRRVTFILVFLALNSLLMFYFNFNHKKQEQILMINHSYTLNKARIDDTNDLSVLLSKLPREMRLFIENEADSNIRFFYQSGTWTPPMVSGNFFKNSDSGRYAVVGGFLGYEVGSFIEIDNTFFEVIGILGASHYSTLDRLVFINYLPSNNSFSRIYVDSENFNIVEAYLKQFDGTVVHQENTLEELIRSTNFYRIVHQNIVVLVTLFCLITSYLYFAQIQRNNEIKLLLGSPRVFVLLGNLAELLFSYVLSIAITQVISFFFLNQNFLAQTGVHFLIFSLMSVSLLFISIISDCSIKELVWND